MVSSFISGKLRIITSCEAFGASEVVHKRWVLRVCEFDRPVLCLRPRLRRQAAFSRLTKGARQTLGTKARTLRAAERVVHFQLSRAGLEGAVPRCRGPSLIRDIANRAGGGALSTRCKPPPRAGRNGHLVRGRGGPTLRDVCCRSSSGRCWPLRPDRDLSPLAYLGVNPSEQSQPARRWREHGLGGLNLPVPGPDKPRSVEVNPLVALERTWLGT